MSVSVALSELDTLLGRKLELDNALGSQDASAKSRPANAFAADFSTDEVKLRLKQLQRWLQVVVTPQQAEQLWSRLLAHEKIFENSNKLAAKGRHTKDKVETVDDVGDDQSPTFFLLETLYKVCGALLQEDGMYLEEDLFNPEAKSKEAKVVDSSVLQSVPESLITFCFSRLHLAFSGAIRRVAGMCLGLLSKHFLQMIASMFLNSLAAIKKDADAREYVTYQKALPLLDFGFRAGDQVNATVTYFSGLAVQMKKIDRGVLRMEVCESLRQIFSKLVSSKTKQAAHWDSFQASESKELNEFQDAVDKIFQIVKQWSKKDKHSAFCYELMCVMVCAVRNPKFYTKYSGELFGLLCGGLKKEKLHAKCLECCAFYVRESPEALVSTDSGFLGRIKTLLGLLLPKGKNPEEPDIPAITQIVQEIGERFSTFIFGEYAVEVLTTKKGNYRTTTKAVVMTALGQIARSQHASRLDKYGPAIAPLVMFFIAEQPKKNDEKKKKDEVLDKRAMLRTAALSCFPYFRETEEGGSSKLLNAIPVIGALTLDPDRAVTSAAVSALTDLMKLDPKTMIVPIVYEFILLLNTIDMVNVQTFLKASNNLSLVLSTVIQVLETPNEGLPAPNVDARAWTNVRRHLEATCVRWLCHSELWLRGEVFRVMRQFSDPVLRSLEGDVQTAHMIDILMPRDSPPEMPSASGFSDPLRKLLLSHYDAFKAPINFAFSLVYDLLPTVLGMDDSTLGVYVHPDNEWWAIFKNILVFCGLAFHPNSSLSDELVTTWSAKTKDKRDDAKSEDTAAGLLAVRVARAGGIVPAARALLVPVLQDFQTSETDCLEYLDFVFKSLHSTHPRLVVVGHLTRKSLYQISPAAYSAIFSCLRREYDTQTTKKKLPHADFLYHDHTLELFAQLLLRTSAEDFFKSAVRVTETLDLLVTTMLTEFPSAEFGKLGPRAKVQLVTLLGQSVVYQLKPSLPGESYEAKGSVAINRPSHFQFLTSKNVFPQASRVLSSDEQEERLVPALEQAIVRCIQALISLGPFANPFMENQVLRFLHRIPINRDEQVQAEAQRAMTVFLQLNPKRLDEFICNSSTFAQEDSLQEHGYPAPTFTGDNFDAEQHEITQNNAVEFGSPSAETIQELRAIVFASRTRARQISLVLGPEETIVHRAELSSPLALRIAVFYVTAVCESWISRLGTAHDWIGTQGVTAATMLAFCLLHRNSPDIRARNQALRLAKALAEKLTPALEPGFKIDELSHSSPFMFVENSLHYSRSLAQQPSNGRILPDLLKECERLNQILADPDRQNLFKMLTPWVEQIGSIAMNPEAKQPFEVEVVFKSIVRLTTQSHRSSATSHVVNELWAAVTRAYAARPFILQIVQFFVGFYSDTEAQHELISRTEDMEPEELRALLKSAFGAMCRGRPFAVVLECMLDCLKHYNEPQSLRSADFLNWLEVHPAPSDVVTPQEHSCFDLLSGAVYGHDDLLHDALPRLLMNACVLFSGTPSALSLLRFVATFLNMGSLTTNTSISTSEFLAAVVSNNGKLRAQWAKEALVWGCMAADPQVASASLEIFQTLTGREPDFVPLQVVRLSLATYAAVKQSQKKLVALSEALLTIPLNDRASWISVAAVGWSLLQITRIDAYRHLSSAGSTNKVVALTLVPGLMSADTQQNTVNILSVLAVHFTKTGSTLPDSHVLCLSVLSTFLFRLMDLLALMLTRYTVPDLKQPSAEDTDQLLGDVETCLRLTQLLKEYKHDGLSRVFYQLSSLLLKDLSADLSPEDTARATAIRTALQSLERNSEEFEVPVVPPPSHQRVSFEIFTTGRNQVNPIVRFFVGSLLAIFSGREMFDSILQWFCVLLRHWSGASEQRMVFLMTLGHVIQNSKHKPNAVQAQQLTEELEKDYLHQKESFRHLVENVARVLCKESSTPPSFSFLRARVTIEKGPKTVLMPFDPAQNLQCLAFLEGKAFTCIDQLVPLTDMKEPSTPRPDREAKEREAQEQRARESKEKEARDKEARDKEARDKEARDKEARDKEARDKEARDKEARDKEARDKEARDKEARDKEAREKEARDKEAREKEARDKEARDKEARDKEARDKEARDKEARDKEARDKEARDKEAKENEAREAREKEARDKEASEKAAKEATETEAKEKEAKEKEAKEKEAKELEAKEKETKELEAKEKEAKDAEQAANKKAEPAFANNLNALLKGGPKQPPPPPAAAAAATTAPAAATEAPDLVTTRRVAPSIARKAPTLKPFVASGTLSAEAASSASSPATNNSAPSSPTATSGSTSPTSANVATTPKATEVKPPPASESAAPKNLWQARIDKEKAEAGKGQTKVTPPVPTTKVPALSPTAKTTTPAATSTKTPAPAPAVTKPATTPKAATVAAAAPPPAAATTPTAVTGPIAKPATTAAVAKAPVAEDDLERASREAAEKLEQARTKLATLRAKAEKERAEKAKAAAEELAG